MDHYTPRPTLMMSIKRALEEANALFGDSGGIFIQDAETGRRLAIVLPDENGFFDHGSRIQLALSAPDSRAAVLEKQLADAMRLLNEAKGIMDELIAIARGEAPDVAG